MSNFNEEMSEEEADAALLKLVETIVLLLAEEPATKTNVEQDRSKEFGIAEELYIGSVFLKNAMVGLFKTMSDSLHGSDKNPYTLVKVNGYMDEPVMVAISARYGGNVCSPLLSAFLAQQFRKAVATREIKTKWWQLVKGEGSIVYIEAIGERKRTIEPREHVRAKPIKFRIAMPNAT